MYVIGTAGHVDHGKSTIVQALTGMDPDRLQEEKERGLTIDLGFAWMRLPNGNQVSIVDVPGHERFVNNMLAGIGGIDLALLVIAADESIMPQTKEHLAILDLLNVSRGVVALTKKDLVEDDWIDLVVPEVEEMLKDTTLTNAQIVPISGKTGEGLDELLTTIENLLHEVEPKEDLGRPRLPIDRSFTLPGFGTIVTGTLIDGTLKVGQEIELLPMHKSSRIRGLQMHQEMLEEALPGNRVAVNLTGIPHDDINRGNLLTTPNWLNPSIAIDVSLKIIPSSPRPVRHNMFVTLHTGSSESVTQIRLLEKDIAEPGDWTLAQLKFEKPLALVKGDYFVIRSNQVTLGGGKVVDTHARRHRRKYQPVLDRLELMEKGSVRDVILKSIEISEPIPFRKLINNANLQPILAMAELETMSAQKLVFILDKGKIDNGTQIYTSAGWAVLTDRACTFLNNYHERYPLRLGSPKEEFRNQLGLTAQVFGKVLDRLKEEKHIVEEGTIVRRNEHKPRLSEPQHAAVKAYLKLLETNPYSPPTHSPLEPEVLKLLSDDGRVVKVTESVVFASSAYEKMVSYISEQIVDRGQVTVGDVRDMFHTSRKYALALLEYLDQQHITRRVGDARVLR